MGAPPSTPALRALRRLTDWERNFLRLRSSGDFGLLRRELGDLGPRPTPDRAYGQIRHEDDAERIQAQIAEKLGQLTAEEHEREPAPDDQAPEEGMVDDDRFDHVRQWCADAGTFTVPEMQAEFGLHAGQARAIAERLAAAGDVVRTDDARPARGNGGRPAVVYRWEHEFEPVAAPATAEEVAQLRHELDTLDEVRQQLAESLQEAHGAIASLRREFDAEQARRDELARAVEDLRGLLDASGMDALDVTLGAAVAGLARIGRGELDPGRLLEEVRRAES